MSRRATAVDAGALVDDAAAHDLLGERAEGGLDLLLGGRRRLGGTAAASSATSSSRSASSAAVRSALSAIDLRARAIASALGLDRGVDARRRVVDLRRRRPSARAWRRPAATSCLLEGDRLADPLLGGLEAVGDDVLGRPWGRRPRRACHEALGAAGLDHHDGDVAVVELHDRRRRSRRWTRRPPRRWGAGSTRRRWCRRCARRRWGRRRGCPRSSARREAPLMASTSWGFSWSAPRIGADDLDLVAEARRGTTGAAGGR